MRPNQSQPFNGPRGQHASHGSQPDDPPPPYREDNPFPYPGTATSSHLGPPSAPWPPGNMQNATFNQYKVPLVPDPWARGGEDQSQATATQAQNSSAPAASCGSGFSQNPIPHCVPGSAQRPWPSTPDSLSQPFAPAYPYPSIPEAAHPYSPNTVMGPTSPSHTAFAQTASVHGQFYSPLPASSLPGVSNASFAQHPPPSAPAGQDHYLCFGSGGPPAGHNVAFPFGHSASESSHAGPSFNGTNVAAPNLSSFQTYMNYAASVNRAPSLTTQTGAPIYGYPPQDPPRTAGQPTLDPRSSGHSTVSFPDDNHGSSRPP